MSKVFQRLIAGLCAAALLATLSGCSDTSWSVKVNGEKAPAGMYIFFLMNISSNIQQQYSTSSNPWAEKVDGKTDAKTYAIDQAVKNTSEMLLIEKTCKTEKVTLTAAEKSNADSQATQYYSSGTASLTANNVSAESLKRVYEDYALANKLYTHLYGDSGTKKISDTDLTKYMADYVRVKHIFFTDKDDSGNALTGSQLTAVKNKVNDVLAQVKKNPSQFDTLMQKYTEDTTGLQQNPDGYTFKKNDTQYVQEFVKAANDMKVGEIRLVTSSLGFHIMEKLDLDKSTMKTQYANELFQKYIDDQYSKAKVERNQATINYYTPAKVA